MPAGNNGEMTHPLAALWPLFDLRVATPRLELRYVDDTLAHELAGLAARGVHDPGFMPFLVPWTDVDPPQQQRNTLQWYWRCRAEMSPTTYHLPLAVIADGAAIGTSSLDATNFAMLRQFETGSWLGVEYQGRGFGRELRVATLQLGFDGLGATLATTGAFTDNAASLGVTRRLGYTPTGRVRRVRRDDVAETLQFEMNVEHWRNHVRRDDITIHGLAACRDLLSLQTS